MYFYHFFTAFIGLSIREIKKFSMQKGRLFSAIVRPALWLFVFAAGVGSAKGVDPGILNFYPIQNINYFMKNKKFKYSDTLFYKMPKEKSIDIDTEKDFKNALKYNQ